MNCGDRAEGERGERGAPPATEERRWTPAVSLRRSAELFKAASIGRKSGSEQGFELDGALLLLFENAIDRP